jgi:SAM-dependent methyltransferase
MAMAIQYIDVRSNNFPVVHFAPESGIQDILISKFGDRYRPADFSPEQYSGWSKFPLQKIDLSRIRDFFPNESVEGFIHSHVLEHLPGSIDRIIEEMNDIIVPGGFHLFMVPIHSGWYKEDMNPSMSSEERTERFNQSDHLRCFGVEDFEERCLRLFKRNFIRYDLDSRISGNDLVETGASVGILNKNTGATPFLFMKTNKTPWLDDCV